MKTVEKKIKKLKKSRLWPSIILFLLSLLAGGLLLCAQFGIYASYVVETKYTQALVDTQGIVRSIDTRMEMGEDLETALTHAAENRDLDRQIAVYDGEKQLLASHGEITVDISQKKTLDTGTKQEIFLDQNSGDVFHKISLGPWLRAQDDSIDTMDIVAAMIRAARSGDYFGMSQAEKDRTILRLEYWQPASLADGSLVLVKDTLGIQQGDLIYGIAVTVVSGGMFLLILSVQLMNVIRLVGSRRRIEKLLTIDTVTGGDNWMAFSQKASRLLSRRRNAGRTFAIVELSLIKYQSYCSLYGAKAGELFLSKISQMLSEQMGWRETFGHVGGGDFALLLCVGPGENRKQKTVERVERLLGNYKKGKKKVEADGIDLSMLVLQAGIYFLDSDQRKSGQEYGPSDVSELYVNAGVAKASIAQDEGGHVACFSQKMLEDQLWQHRVENTMQVALDNEEFQVYVQPKYDPNSGELRGGEALVRWVSPTDGIITPGRFVPIFEKTGFVTKLDDYMISHVAKLQSGWIAEGKKIVPISVNVSRAHFAQPDLAEQIRNLVDAYGVPHKYIEIELTESAFFDDKKALLGTVCRLQKYGFEVSMDDFGSGYSSLNSLKDLPLNVLKLDAGFFRGNDIDDRGQIVVSKAIALAKQLDMKIVAEGVEKKEQVDFLAKQGCDLIQGYYFAKPMPAAEYAQRLK